MLAVPGSIGGLVGSSSNYDAVNSNNLVVKARERHQVQGLEDWIDNSPPSLFDLCIKNILDHLTETICRIKPSSSSENAATNSLTLELRPGVRCDSRTTDALLQYYIYNRLNDDFHIVSGFTAPSMRHLLDRVVLSMFIESHERLHLTYADLEDVSEREPKLLTELLKCSPQLQFLTVSANKLNVSDFIDALERSPARLRALSFVNLKGDFSAHVARQLHAEDVAGVTTTESYRFGPHRLTPVFGRNNKTISLVQHLALVDSRDDDNNIHRDVCCILASFDKLRHLQLTSAASLTGLHLTRFQSTMQVLDLHDCKLEVSDFNAISTLHELRILDVSQPDAAMPPIDSRCLSILNASLTKLVELDISGTTLCDRLHGSDLSDEAGFVKSSIDGLKGRTRMLEFLGLFTCRGNPCALPYLPAKKVTGDASEGQVLASLERYMRRFRFIHRALNDVYRFLRHDPCTKPFYTLKLILDAMSVHAKSMRIQIAGSAALFYVIKNDLRNILPIKVKRQVLRVLIDAMQNHAKEQTMLRNGCLTLCQFQIPDDVMFIYEDVVKVLLLMLGQAGLEEFLMRIAVLLLNSLACQVENEHKLLLGKLGTVDVMLEIIKERLQRAPADLPETQREIMDVAWSILWNVTDETPDNCRRFFERDGMQFFLDSRRKYPENAELLRNIMGLLGNVAEVPELRAKLMHDAYLEVFSELLESESDGIEVSYNACGVLAHICSDGPSTWNVTRVSRPETLDKMILHINRWSLKSKRNINYRSFEPILRLVPCEQSTASQHWACWALANLTRVLPAKYCELLEREGGIEKLNAVVGNSTVRRDTLRYATLALRHIDNYKKNVPENLWDIDTDEIGPQGSSEQNLLELWSLPAASYQQQQQQQQEYPEQLNNNNNFIPPINAVADALYQAVGWAAQLPPPLGPILALQQQPPPPINQVDVLFPAAPAGAAAAADEENDSSDDDGDDDDDDDVEMQFALENLIQAHQLEQQQQLMLQAGQIDDDEDEEIGDDEDDDFDADIAEFGLQGVGEDDNNVDDDENVLDNYVHMDVLDATDGAVQIVQVQQPQQQQQHEGIQGNLSSTSAIHHA